MTYVGCIYTVIDLSWLKRELIYWTSQIFYRKFRGIDLKIHAIEYVRKIILQKDRFWTYTGTNNQENS